MTEAEVSLHNFFSSGETRLEGLDLSKFDTSQACREVRQAVVSKAGSGTWNAIREGLGEEIGKMLKGMSIVGILATAWSKSTEIQKYRDTAKYPPGKPVNVTLYNHDISSVQKPKLKAVLREAVTGFERSFEIPLEVALKLSLEGVVLEFNGGKLTSIRSAAGKGKLEIKIEGVSIYKTETRAFKLPGNYHPNDER